MKTPVSLLESIKNGLELNDVELGLSRSIRDFLAQKFGAATLSVKTEDELNLIKDLWFKITGEVMK